MPNTSVQSPRTSNNISKNGSHCQGYVPIAANGHKESVYALATNDSATLLVSGGTEKASSGCLTVLMIYRLFLGKHVYGCVMCANS